MGPVTTPEETRNLKHGGIRRHREIGPRHGETLPAPEYSGAGFLLAGEVANDEDNQGDDSNDPGDLPG